ncbi:hypothetical protein PAP_06560 [Palaeococcus pacificus DY20341]|uniref:Uncharacterized protein n=1 Tax=Palaeococcus pacificus DY20341 TaxID=1343739 RepID=A0A075LTM5_9EURY|nr:hypothetical protein [Palaeococcus pacificus]AIF69709.1 hypothetical protein PAP_06560 [Palaeococcus pacificus DY20341]
MDIIEILLSNTTVLESLLNKSPLFRIFQESLNTHPTLVDVLIFLFILVLLKPAFEAILYFILWSKEAVRILRSIFSVIFLKFPKELPMGNVNVRIAQIIQKNIAVQKVLKYLDYKISATFFLRNTSQDNICNLLLFFVGITLPIWITKVLQYPINVLASFIIWIISFMLFKFSFKGKGYLPSFTFAYSVFGMYTFLPIYIFSYIWPDKKYPLWLFIFFLVISVITTRFIDRLYVESWINMRMKLWEEYPSSLVFKKHQKTKFKQEDEPLLSSTRLSRYVYKLHMNIININIILAKRFNNMALLFLKTPISLHVSDIEYFRKDFPYLRIHTNNSKEFYGKLWDLFDPVFLHLKCKEQDEDGVIRTRHIYIPWEDIKYIEIYE